MRISDWSSDVCSSDLGPVCTGCQATSPFHLRGRRFLSRLFQATRQRTNHDVAAVARTTARPGFVASTPVRRCARQQQRRSRSEEHTSELQSLMRISYAVFCLKKKTKTPKNQKTTAL